MTGIGRGWMAGFGRKWRDGFGFVGKAGLGGSEGTDLGLWGRQDWEPLQGYRVLSSCCSMRDRVSRTPGGTEDSLGGWVAYQRTTMAI